MTLEQVLADAREDLAVAKRLKDARAVELLEPLVDRVEHAAADYLVWLSEAEARLRSGRTIAWLRSRFPEWERQGHAKLDGKRRVYRTLIVPTRANAAAAYAAGRRNAG